MSTSDHSFSKLVTAVCAVAALGLGGCEADPTPALADGGTAASGCSEGAPMTVLQANFANFTSWTRFDLGPDAGGDGLGDVGDRVVYLNQIPPHGSTEFPVGTLLVKTSGSGPTFGMAKVGGCYNQSGAKDWEWFELSEQTGGSTTIVWRGVEAPAGDTYNNAAPNSCNACHASFSSNDYVPSAPLALTNF